jgi:hypothetical protein
MAGHQMTHAEFAEEPQRYGVLASAGLDHLFGSTHRRPWPGGRGYLHEIGNLRSGITNALV